MSGANVVTHLLGVKSSNYTHVVTLVTSVVLMFGLAGLLRYSMGVKGEKALVPCGRPSFLAFFDLLVSFIRDLSQSVIGEGGKSFVPFFTFLFAFILVNNWMGMLPGMSAATENINTGFAMGLTVFVIYNYIGIRKQGLSYLKHLMGPVLLLAPIMFVIELISHAVRPFSLSIRLSKVLMGDHMVVQVFLDLIPIILPIPFYLLGIFICFIQAYVFTMLSMVYVAMAQVTEH